MREIKFRAWDKINNCWLDWSEQRTTLEFENGVPCRIVLHETEGYLEKGDFELVEFTGLKDKHGGEIYEGDIVREWNGDMREIVFNSSRAAFIAKMCPKPMVDMPTWIRRIKEPEVISNIYENPELLVKKDK